MIRRKISTGILRATKSTGNLRASAGTIPPLPGQQNASLASATLLNSQRNWQKETVVTLKSELKARGLSQAGVKSVLISRLESAESSTFLPPTAPSLPRAGITTPSRKITTETTLPEAPKKSSSDTDPKSKPVDPVADDHVASTGPQILSQRSEATKPEPIKAEDITVAPGLPETKDAMKSTKKDTLDVKMPGPPREAEDEQIIPLTPDNFKSNKSLPAEPEKIPDAFMPKVMTVASASTHIAGGPQSAVHESTDATTHEGKEKAEEVVEKVKDEIPGLLSAVSGVLTAPVRGLKNIGLDIEVGAPKGKASGEYKASGEKLNAEERRGAWVLGGIVGLGLLLGGGRKSKKAEGGNEGHPGKGGQGGKGGSGGKGGKSGALGDAQWEKPSGAGVVGHGARKD